MAVAIRADAWDSAGLPPIAAAGLAAEDPDCAVAAPAGAVAGIPGAAGVLSAETVAITTEEGWLPPDELQAIASEQKSKAMSVAARIDS